MLLYVVDGLLLIALVNSKNCRRFLVHHSGVKLPPYRPY
jgi:hypothetical protein